MRGMVLSSFLLLSFAGGGLFHVKYQVALLADQLKVIQHKKEETIQAIHLLQAEWAYLNEPSRLETLAKKYLTLAPSVPHQILSAADFGMEREGT